MAALTPANCQASRTRFAGPHPPQPTAFNRHLPGPLVAAELAASSPAPSPDRRCEQGTDRRRCVADRESAGRPTSREFDHRGLRWSSSLVSPCVPVL
jgi:hypothetical protein